MNDAGIAGVVQLRVDIDSVLDDIKCESSHKTKGNRICSHTVTHSLAVACKGISGLICTNAAIKSQHDIDSPFVHHTCGRKFSECVTLRPL